MSDVLLCQINDGGEISLVNGDVELTGGFETAAYLSLFGGNEDDDGKQDSNFSWWGNLGENQPSRRYVSETQYLLRSIAITTANLIRIKDAGERDLNWFLQEGVATSVDVEIIVPELNKVMISINIESNNESTKVQFLVNWVSIL